jgi:diguanylate cyclase (GGDEF)-like protein
MSLIRQVWLLLLGTLVLAFVGGTAINVDSTRRTLETQLRLKNSDNAATLALALSQQKGQRDLMELLVAAQFDTGFYRRIRVVGTDAKLLIERAAPASALHAPDWFVALTPIESVPGVAQVSDGWRALGSVEVVSQTAYVHDDLWRASLHSALALALVGLGVGAIGAAFVARWRRPLDQAVEQARSIEQGRYLSVEEPRVPELRRLTRAMNSMVQRLKRVFEAQAAQVDAMRAQASNDTLTGVSNRGHFMARLGAMLQAEDGAAASGLVLVRVLRLAEVNTALGHATTDRILQSIAQALETYAGHVPGCFIGRLNGSDFALCLPAAGVALETAQSVNELLQVALPAFGPRVAVAAGAVEARRGVALATLMGSADMALARAESRGAFAVEAGDRGDPPLSAWGEAAWRESLHDALAQGRVSLGSFVLIDAQQRLVHLESPLRLQLEADGPHEVAAHWLPLAVRSRLTPQADAHALALALAAIAQDGQPRCVNLSPASLADSGFTARIRALLLGAPRAATKVWIEIGETAAADHFDLVQELGRQLRPTGARFGLEHAGERIGAIERLFEAGLDYVKLDAAVVAGVAGDADRTRFVRSLVAMLHALALQVFAEGVVRDDDAQALWACGVDAITGPWATARVAAPR